MLTPSCGAAQSVPDIKIFSFGGGDPSAVDVCNVLGLGQVSRAMKRLDEDEGGLQKVTHPQNPGRSIIVNVVNEPGLYRLILCSNKPEAKVFRR